MDSIAVSSAMSSNKDKQLTKCISDVEQIEAKVNNKHSRLTVIEEEQDALNLDSCIIY